MTSSLTPRQGNPFGHKRSASTKDEQETRGGLAPPPPRQVKDSRSMSNITTFGPRTASLANSVAPGSFSSTLTQTNNSRVPLRPELTSYAATADGQFDEATASERRQADYRDKINKEMKIKVGAENMLAVLLSKNPKQTKDQRLRAESELGASNQKIASLQSQLQDEIDRSRRAAAPAQNRLSQIFRGSPLRSPSRQSQEAEEEQDAGDTETASPTFVLSETLQELERENRQADYYVHRANGIAELFKRNPTLKYDLAWSIFGVRVQTMMLSDSKEVSAAGYRVTRHAFADRKSLQTVRSLQTDVLVIDSLAKDSKATIEREQALKFVRAFLDVKDGIKELSNGVLRAVVAVAEHYEDRLRNIAVLTLAEILIRDPLLVVRAGGITPLYEALKDGSYPGSDSLVSIFLYLTDTPQLRKLITPGYELAGPFGLFSDALPVHGHEDRMKSNIKAISAILNSWPGLFALSQNGFGSVTSLIMALSHPSTSSRNLILDLVFDILNIKPPTWTSSFLAGRRLTTYGRVANLREDPMEHQSRLEDEDDLNRANLIDHYTALVLLILVKCGLIEALTELTEDLEDMTLHRKTTLLLSEVLKLADHALPVGVSAGLHALPALMRDDPTQQCEFNTPIVSNMAFQIDSVNRTLHRTQKPKAGMAITHARNRSRSDSNSTPNPNDARKTNFGYDMDEITFRSKMAESQVVGSPNYLKWKWDLINDIIEGPLRNPKRLEDAKSTKFMKRLLGFYRPFKYRFSESRNTKPNQRYVKTGCALMKSLLASSEGVQILADNKLLRQLAECLAQIDRMSGITSSSPLFSQERVAETLTGNYFAILGALSSDPLGLQMLIRWRMINMFYHIIDLRDRDDIVQLLLESMDFTLDSHLRVMVSKALTAGPKSIRTFATKLLRKFATQEIEPGGSGVASNVACWAIRLLVTQLYDPDVEVSEVAVQILQEACNRKQYLEYVVKCRPALDHLGEIGAPLLLRFLSTSLGYKYLHGLDYITQEMDDWFLGRNERYVTLVEASLSRGFAYEPERAKPAADDFERQQLGIVPPHFYRELSRTKEGCRLLSESGHFEDFVSTIKDFWAEDEDQETMLKVKGCLWAVGNVGSMELGAPFLEQTNVVEWILKIVEHSGVMTMRGTAFFVLGLISRSWHGMEILAERGWDASTNHLGQSLGYVLPPSLNILFPEAPRTPHRLPPPLATMRDAPPPLNKDDALEGRIYSSVIDAGNTVLSRRALNDLNA